MMACLVPNELWSLVLGRLKDLCDIARAQRVSRRFRSIVLATCWTQINRLEIQMDHLYMIFTVNESWKKKLSPQLGLELGKELARKTSAVTVLHLEIFAWTAANRKVLDNLTSTSLKIEELKWTDGDFGPLQQQSLVEFLLWTSLTLKRLSLTFWGSRPETELPMAELQQAFRSCSLVESLRIFGVDYWRSDDFPLSVLAGQTQLKNLAIDGWWSVASLSDAILSSGASLRKIDFKQYHLPHFFSIYKTEVVGRRLLAHPLLSVEELVLEELGSVADHLSDLFPQLKVLHWDFAFTRQPDKACALVRNFLALYCNAKDEKLLQCLFYYCFFVDELVSAVERALPCRSQFLDDPEEIIFRKGNATISIRCLNSLRRT